MNSVQGDAIPRDEIVKWIEKKLDTWYRTLKSAEEACLVLTDRFQQAFPDLRVTKDLWVSADFYEWCISIRRGNGPEVEIAREVGNGHA